MLCIDSQTANPYYNLAAEEYFLKESDEEYFILWESVPSVIVGKHQNTLAEINYRYLIDNNIQVARRLSGGGTVFHGSGNINFTFIRNGLPGHLVNFNLFIGPVLEFLKSLGINAHKGSKHEIIVNGRKISGNAEHVFKNRVLHHGTLLFDANLETLAKSISRTGGTYNDKSVQSNRADVLNIVDCLSPRITKNEFRSMLYSHVTTHFKAEHYIHDEHVENRIQTLIKEKYSTWDWIYGWSPDYRFTNKWTNGFMNLDISLDVHRGTITTAEISGREIRGDQIKKLLTGEKHSYAGVSNALKESGVKAPAGKDFDDLVYAFF